MTRKQEYLLELLRPVFGFYKVKFGSSFSGSIGVNGYIDFGGVNRCKATPLRLQMECDYKTYMRIWLDKLKDGTYSLKFKTYGDHIDKRRADEVVRSVLAIESWQPYITGVDIYGRCEGYHYRKDIPTLRIHLKSLPWKQTKVK